MTTANTETAGSVKLGDTFIAYVDAYTNYVGITIKNLSNDRIETLVLGWFTGDSYDSNKDVCNRTKKHDFPSLYTSLSRRIFPYNFGVEFGLLKSHKTMWDTDKRRPCRSNLLSSTVGPKNQTALGYIHIAQHVMSGGTIDDYESCYDYFDDESFLNIWAVLYTYFPDKVTSPPKEWDAKNSNVYYKITPPTVEMGLR